MLRKLLGRGGLAAMSAVIMCSTFGAINTNLLQAPRITFAMGRDGVFFRLLGSVHANYRTPAVAIAVMAIMSILLVLAVAMAKHLVVNSGAGSAVAAADGAAPRHLLPLVVASLRNDSIFSLLTNFVIFSASIFYMLGVLAVIVLRIRQPECERPYKTLGYPLVPILFLSVYVWFIVQIYRSNPLESRTGLMFIAIGVPAYFVYQRLSHRAHSLPESAET
jgi:APA family basic amino acid/polyamine antiporter